MLSVKNISAADATVPLHNVSYEFGAGLIYTILGRTGAGKTELLRALIGLLELGEGEISLDGQSLGNRPIRERQMALVYQQFINYPHLNVLDNVAFPLRRQGLAKKEARSRAARALDMLGLSEFVDRRPSQLSGGQQQRVALARAMVKQARILMLDEPLANLDYKLREQLREEFPRLVKGQTDSVILYTTTEPQEAMQLGDRMLVMDKGRIVAHGVPADLFDRPPTLATARVISDPPLSFFDAQVRDGRLICTDGTELPVGALVLPPPGPVTIGLRPDAFAPGGQFDARVMLTEVSGSETIVHLRFSFGEAVMLVEGVKLFEIGTEIGVTLQPDNLMLFDAHGRNISERKPG